ncbi:MAG: D-alanyl-D-alanine carboxypeptidase [Clostridia bacterium]|nr:D-alanyl-D-alanine carboxypeptidase [Clostridia bacterium]
MKRLVSIIVLIVTLCVNLSVYAKDMETLTGRSLILASGDGKVLFEKNADEKLPPASVTKITTALLVMEAIDQGKVSFEDIVTVSETAANKTGSHIFLAPGEEMSVKDLMKGLMVASGNDAAIALAEHLCGSEEAFVKEMNAKAKKLGMKNTNYINCNGLDADNHYSSARDIMIVTSELMKYEKIFEFSTIWMDTLRNGEFQLANTNKLVRFYEGANGMKTGSTSIAKYCLSATAKRNDVQLIAVVLQAPTSKDRFGDASTMLNYGFNTYENVKVCEKGKVHSYTDVKKGTQNSVGLMFENDFSSLEKKGNAQNIHYEIKNIEEFVTAPVKKGEKLGTAEIYNGEKKIGEVSLVARDSIEKVTLWYTFTKLYNTFANFII